MGKGDELRPGDKFIKCEHSFFSKPNRYENATRIQVVAGFWSFRSTRMSFFHDEALPRVFLAHVCF